MKAMMLSLTIFIEADDIVSFPFFQSVSISVNRKFRAWLSAVLNRSTFLKGLNEIGLPFSKV